jgi:carbamoyl-phosphate synthase large subunit
VSGENFISIATEAILGIENKNRYQTLDLEHVGVKNPQFSYNRLKGADPVAGVEMASTGEVACFGSNINEAFYRSWLATEQQVKQKSLFLSVPDEHKHKFIDGARELTEKGWKIYTSAGTHDFLKEQGVKTALLHKIKENKEPSIRYAITGQKVGLVVSIPSINDDNKDAYIIRRLAIDSHIPLLTNAETGRLLLRCLADEDLLAGEPKAWQEYVPQMA